jgi:hypothetical protein
MAMCIRLLIHKKVKEQVYLLAYTWSTVDILLTFCTIKIWKLHAKQIKQLVDY